MPRVGDLDWTFPPFGNRISFHHLQHDSDRQEWQGSQVTYFGIDELTHFNESSILYVIFSRARSACRIPSYTRCTCNPDPGWVKDFLAPWVDREFKGTPARSGEIRWFIRSEGRMQWVDRSEPHARSITFIGARLEDNPILLRDNPEYVSSLKALNPVDYRRLYLGDWNVRRTGLVYQDFEQCIVT